MTTLKQQAIMDEIESLPIDLNTQIVAKILHDINPTNKNIDSLWIKEANKRKKDIKTKKIKPIDGEEVFKKIAQKYSK